ncbi:hypothetical protein MKEN_00228400 [Mycena kentingensis (nom. inval.)]|nr:hypothetical protein MKEN_00228400 [Mycena kentingensis (nom. inval.)]
MSVRVIYDDRDPAVEYFPSRWPTEGFGMPLEFDSTTSSPVKQGQSAVFRFSGSAVTVFGTLAAGNGSSMSFQIDDQDAVAYDVRAKDDTKHHQSLFTASKLSETGMHTLTMVSTGPDASQIFLDYFLVQTSDVPASGKSIFVDDRDGRAADIVEVSYSEGQWSVLRSEAYFGSSVHSGTPGSSLVISFQGTQLTLRGPIAIPFSGSDAASLPYTAFASIDGGALISLTPPANFNQLPGATMLNNLLFISPVLSPRATYRQHHHRSGLFGASAR